MREQIIKIFTQRTNIRQLFVICAVGTCAFASDLESLKVFNPNYRIQERAPQSFLPDGDYIPAPQRKELWLEKVLVEDDAGVLVSIRKDFSDWDETEEYVKNWDLESTGLYDVKTPESKRSYLGKRILKYFDKRISGEVKKAPKGSKLHKVGQVQKALKPTTKVAVNKYLKLRFKARVLQGKAIMKVENPFVDADTTYEISHGLKMNLAKKIEVIDTTAKVEYRPTDNDYKASLVKNFTSRFGTELSTTDNYEDEKGHDTRLRFFFNAPFNY